MFINRALQPLTLLLIGALLLSGVAPAHAASLRALTALREHTATQLLDGRVLVAGGEDRNGPLTNAELYDPVGNRWRTLPGRAAGRVLHTATLLLDGRVLVAGGLGQAGTLDDVFAYAPAAIVQAPTLMAAGLDAAEQVVVRGSGFRPAASAAGDATHQSATNAPLVQLRHLDSERVVYPGQAAGVALQRRRAHDHDADQHAGAARWPGGGDGLCQRRGDIRALPD